MCVLILRCAMLVRVLPHAAVLRIVLCCLCYVHLFCFVLCFGLLSLVLGRSLLCDVMLCAVFY